MALPACAHVNKTAISVSGFDEIDESSLLSKGFDSLSMAKEDFAAVELGRSPINAKRTTVLRDGGTSFYDGQGYRLVSHRKLQMRDGVLGRIVGPTVTLHREITGGRSIIIDGSEFWLGENRRRIEVD